MLSLWDLPYRNTTQYDLVDNGNSTKTLIIAVPGLRKEDLKVTFANQKLAVKSNSACVKNGYKMVHQGIPAEYDIAFSIPRKFRVETAVCAEGLLSILLVPNEIDDVDEVTIK